MKMLPRQKKRSSDLCQYKWLILVAGFCIQLTLSGVTYCVGVFYVIFQENLQGSSTVLSLANSLNMCFTFGVGPIAGALTDKYGCRPVAIFGTFVATLGLILTVFVTAPWQLCLTFGVISGIGIGLSYIPSITIVSQYFTKKRPMAMGIVSAGLGAGQIVFPPFVQFIQYFYDWRGALLIVAGLYMHTFIFSTLLKPKNGPNCGEHSPGMGSVFGSASSIDTGGGKENMHVNGNLTKVDGLMNDTINKEETYTLKDTQRKRGILQYLNVFLLMNIHFDLYLIHNFLLTMGGSVLYVHSGAYAKMQGHSDDKAAMLYFFIGVIQPIARVLYGLLAQVKAIGALKPYLAAVTLCGISIIIYPFSISYIMMCVVVTCIGCFWGSVGSLPPLITLDLVGEENIATAYGYVGVLAAIGYVLGAPIGAWLHELTDYYPSAFIFGGSAMATSVLLLIPLLFK